MARRYFRVRIASEGPLLADQFGAAVTDVVRRYFGEVGLVRIEPRMIKFDAQRSEAVFACRRDAASQFEAALALLSHVYDAGVAPIVVGISGTIKGLRRKK